MPKLIRFCIAKLSAGVDLAGALVGLRPQPSLVPLRIRVESDRTSALFQKR